MMTTINHQPDIFQKRHPKPLYFDQQRNSAVLIPIVNEEKGFSILFEVRASHLLHQPDEVCFPGGKCESGESDEQTAIRETCEEILISSSQIDLIAPLDYFVSYAGYRVTPFLGKLKSYCGTFNSKEVKEIFTVPLNLNFP